MCVLHYSVTCFNNSLSNIFHMSHFWFTETDNFMDDIEFMIGFKPHRIWIYLWKFITPGVIVVCAYLQHLGTCYSSYCLIWKTIKTWWKYEGEKITDIHFNFILQHIRNTYFSVSKWWHFRWGWVGIKRLSFTRNGFIVVYIKVTFDEISKCNLLLFFLQFIWLFSVITLGPVTFGGQSYPHWAIVFGWCLGVSSVIPIPALIVYQILQEKGTLRQVRFLEYSKL